MKDSRVGISMPDAIWRFDASLWRKKSVLPPTGGVRFGERYQAIYVGSYSGVQGRRRLVEMRIFPKLGNGISSENLSKNGGEIFLGAKKIFCDRIFKIQSLSFVTYP